MVKIGKADGDRCRRCDKENTEHLVLHCTRYNKERREIKRALLGLPLTLQVLFCIIAGKEALASYLQKTKICTTEWLQE